MLRVTLEEAKPRLSDLINAALEGKTVFIMKDLEETVQLVPASLPQKRYYGSAKGQIVMADDFDAPLPDFEAYGRSSMPPACQMLKGPLDLAILLRFASRDVAQQEQT